MWCIRSRPRTVKHLLDLQRSSTHVYRSSSFTSDQPKPFSASLITATSIDTHLDSTLPAILATNETILHTIHDSLPWWATIVSSTILLRSCLTLPIAVYQQQSLGKMIQLAPMVQSWGETLKQQVGKESTRQGWSYLEYQAQLQKQYRQKVNQIYAHYGCSRWKLLLLPYVQIPLFISMSLTLRHMAAMPLPYWGQTSAQPVPGLSEEGLAWFTDLTMSDPTLTIPVLIGAGNLLNVELNAWYARKAMTFKQKVMTNIMRVVSIAFVPIAAQTPMAIGLYWLSSAWYSVIQNVAFRVPAVRKSLGMPLFDKLKQQQQQQ
ncbi:60Kd inner membrane protein-domain-containing protein [Blakeslea trispora]|nr:60Kd inner membrane protein-domain-containing protein [Blakeslea trispora]